MVWNKDSQHTHDPIIQGRSEADIDVGLRSHMMHVYNTMGIGLVITALVSLLIVSIPPLTTAILGNNAVLIAFGFAPLAFLWFGFSPARVKRSSANTVKMMFYSFAALFGVSLSSLYFVFTGESIVRVFFITAGMFLATSLWGYTTKKDLSAMGSFLIMGLIGLIIAGLVNLFLHSEMVHWISSIIGVVIFTGMTAWDTQQIKEQYHHARDSEDNSKLATIGALELYMNFILLFQNLLQLLGERE